MQKGVFFFFFFDILFVGLFHLKDAQKSSSPKQIQISNSEFVEMESMKNDMNTLSQGGSSLF
jgi:hypothetical protein